MHSIYLESNSKIDRNKVLEMIYFSDEKMTNPQSESNDLHYTFNSKNNGECCIGVG